MHKKVIPATVQRWADRNKDKVSALWCEYDEFEPTKGPYSLWCELYDGWVCGDVHLIHEPTANDFLKAAARIKSCSCLCCLKGLNP